MIDQLLNAHWNSDAQASLGHSQRTKSYYGMNWSTIMNKLQIFAAPWVYQELMHWIINQSLRNYEDKL